MENNNVEITMIKVGKSWRESTAAALAQLCYLMDLSVDEEELFGVIFDILEENEGEIAFEDLKTIAAMAKATKFSEKHDRWQ